MIYIVHGTDYTANRKIVKNQQKKITNVIVFEKKLEELTPDELNSQVSAFGIFGETPFVVIDISASKTGDYTDHIQIIKDAPETATVILLANKSLTKSNAFIKAAASLKAKIVENTKPIEGNVFAYVDAVFAKDRTKAYKELQKAMTLEDNDPIYFFSLLLYGLRTVGYLVCGSDKGKTLSPFTKSKYEKFATKFSEQSIKEIYTYFYDLDKNAKTGVMPLDLLLPLAMEKVINSE